MIDTVLIESPELDEKTVQAIELFCLRRSCVKIDTGDMLYEYTNGELKNSADCRISLRILREKWVYTKEAGKTTKTTCGDYLRIECSIHKLMMGHNIYGGTSRFADSVRWLLDFIGEQLGHSLPSWELWKVCRIDTAEVYLLDSSDSVHEWFEGVQRIEYQRRKAKSSKYSNTGLYFAGVSTTLKFYHKGSEYRKNDYKRLKQVKGDKIAGELLDVAQKIIRAEVEIKQRKLKYDFKKIPYVGQITDEYILSVYDKELERVKLSFEEGVTMITRSRAVEQYIYTNFKSNLAGTLFGTWTRLSINGEEATKKAMAKRTYQRHVKYLKDHGLSWLNTDMQIVVQRKVPADFSPVRSDKRNYSHESDEVTQMLLKYTAIS